MDIIMRKRKSKKELKEEKISRRRITKNSSLKKGMKPGTLIHIGQEKSENTIIEVIQYNAESLVCEELESVKDLKLSENMVNWIIIKGISNINKIEEVGKEFSIHSMFLEDILNTKGRPKSEDFSKGSFTIVKNVEFNNDTEELEIQQISIFLGEYYCLCFLEKETDLFNNLKRRITQSKGHIREKGNNYLLYAILDSIVDNYFEAIEKIEDSLEKIEEELINSPSSDTLKSIYKLKRELVYLRKLLWPLREIINNFKSESFHKNEEKNIFLNDIYDHIIEITDTVQLFIDITTGMLDTYLSSVNNKMNEIVKVLTIFSTIFIPITFLAGVYGMNFENIPELKWRYSYLIFWVISIFSTISMLIYFRKKKWI